MAARDDTPAFRGRAGDGSLRGWKEIAAFLGVDERTVKRWEQSRGLPVRRVPGKARAPVFVFPDELTAWLASRDGQLAEPAVAGPAPDAAGRNRPRLLAGLALAVAVLAGLLLWRLQQPAPSAADARRLAAIAAMADRLERQPGTLKMRAALTSEAATQLARVAEASDASPALKREAAATWLRLASVQDSTNRPSLRDAAAADASLARAWLLVAGDNSRPGRHLAGRVLLAQALHHAGARRLPPAVAALERARPLLADADASTRSDLALAMSELASWQGRYAETVQLATAQFQPLGRLPADDWLRQVRARDLAAEGEYYQGRLAQAAQLYGAALSGAQAGARQWPEEPRLRWAIHRQQWNVGTTLLQSGETGPALPQLHAARDGWLAMAQADPDDAALAWWLRTARMSYGEGLAAAGQLQAAIAELSLSLAERRSALAAAPASIDRQDALVAGLGALGNTLARSGRVAEGCLLLNEARDVIGRMAKAGQLAPNDIDRLVKGQQQSRARWCRATTAGA